jgi:hypothetical protein
VNENKMDLDEALEMVRRRAWAGAPADLDRAFDVVFAAVRELERLRKVEDAARVVLDALKDTRMGPGQEDAFEVLFDLVRPEARS